MQNNPCVSRRKANTEKNTKKYKTIGGELFDFKETEVIPLASFLLSSFSG